MPKALSTRKLAVAERYSQRLKLLFKKGIDIEGLKSEIGKIEGVSVSSKNRIRIDTATYSKSGSDIIKSLESLVPKSKEFGGSKAKKVIAAKKLEKEMRIRADEVVAKFDINKQEYVDRALDVEGVSKDEFGNLVISPDDYNEDLEKAVKKELFTSDELIEATKDDLEEEGLSEGDIENMDEATMIKHAKAHFMKKDERSIFKKYYDYFDKYTHLAKNQDSYRMKRADYDKAQKAMSELGKVLSREGFSSSAYYDKKIEVDKILKNLV